MTTGTVKFFDEAKNYGFIISDADQSQIFVHKSQLGEGVSITANDKVEFTVWPNEKNGKVEAKNVTKIDDMSMAA